MERIKNPKLIAAVLVAALAVIIFLQNRALIVLKVLWLAKVETNVSTALSAAFLVGLVTGALAFSHWKTKREKAKSATSSASL